MAGPRGRRALVDALLVVGAVVFGLTAQQQVLFGGLGHLRALSPLDVAVGAACLSSVVWLRRPAPVLFTLAAVAASTVSSLAGAVPILGVLTVAVHRRWPVAVAVAVVVALNAGVVQLLVVGVPDPASTAVGGVLLTAGATGWGMFVRARRQVLALLRRQVEEARAAARDRDARARAEERTRIAREMHDALGHRLSLLAVHGGALAFRRDASADDVAAISATIRDQAHLALDELRSVVAVLRDPADGAGPPAPGLRELPDLVDDARAAGLQVDLDPRVDADDVPAPLGCTAYRVAQEALTNSRRHGCGRPVHVRVGGTPGGEFVVAVEEIGEGEEIGAGAPAAAPSPTGTGLVGLRERVDLAGGHLEAGPGSDGGFRVRAVLPWRVP